MLIKDKITFLLESAHSFDHNVEKRHVLTVGGHLRLLIEVPLWYKLTDD